MEKEFFVEVELVEKDGNLSACNTKNGCQRAKGAPTGG